MYWPFGKTTTPTPPPATGLVGLYREPVSQVHVVGDSVIQDRGVLRAAYKAQNGFFLFSEISIGVQSMALIGTRNELLGWLHKNRTSGIENRIGELPDIFLDIQTYVPGSRFSGLFPVHAIVKTAKEAFVDCLQGVTANGRVGGAVFDYKDAYDNVKSWRNPENPYDDAIQQHNDPEHGRGGTLYLKFHYIQTNKAAHIGSGRVEFFPLITEIVKACR